MKRSVSQDGSCNKSKYHENDDETCDFHFDVRHIHVFDNLVVLHSHNAWLDNRNVCNTTHTKIRRYGRNLHVIHVTYSNSCTSWDIAFTSHKEISAIIEAQEDQQS